MTNRCATATSGAGPRAWPSWTSTSAMPDVVQAESLVLVRSLPGTPDRVWRAWVEADALRAWFGQSEFAGWQADLDVREGGRYRLLMSEPDGTAYRIHGVYREVTPYQRLAFTWIQYGGAYEG